MTEDPRSPRLPVCQRCEHFFVTWDPAAPNGCHAMGFKTRRSPSLVVYESSGMACQKFRERERKRTRSDP